MYCTSLSAYCLFFFFFFTDTATTEIYTLSLHDALPICWRWRWTRWTKLRRASRNIWKCACPKALSASSKCCPSWLRRSEEHTSELQSRVDLVCRLLLEKKNKNNRDSSNHNATYIRTDHQ